MYMYYNWKMKLFILVSLVKYQVQLFTIISYMYIWSYVLEMHEKQNYEARWINFLFNFNHRKRFYINETIKIPIFPRARICERE